MEQSIKNFPLSYVRYGMFVSALVMSLLFGQVNLAKAASETTSSSILNQNFAANNTFVFSPRTLSWKAINSSGKVVRTGRASGGRHYCPDIHRSCRTPTGTYSIISKGGANCRSSRFPVGKGGAPMPYCMFFSRYYAVHGSYDVPNYNASHGCIRVPPAEAHWLTNNFMHIGTRVVVKPY